MGISERQKELKRRRKRRTQLRKLRARLDAAHDGKEKQRLLAKIRRISPELGATLTTSHSDTSS